MKILQIIELEDLFIYLKKRGILNQYKKSKDLLLSGNLISVQFKKRKPKTSKIYQFRINHKYRAFGYFDKNNNIFRIIEILDHQDF